MSTLVMRQWNPELDAQLRRHLEEQYPAEGCGVLIGRGDGVAVPWEVTEILTAPNIHGEDRKRRYLIPPQFQLQAERAASAKDQDVIGFYHSHPDHPARPSEHDRELAWPGYLYTICAVTAGKSTDLRSFAFDDGAELCEVSLLNSDWHDS